MDQTSAAVYAGIIAAPASAVLLRTLTGWPLWVATLVGMIGGFLGTAIAVYFLIEIVGRTKPRRGG